jgi:4-hydroxybutyrate dehydrogenase
MMPAVLQFNKSAAPDKLADAARYLGIERVRRLLCVRGCVERQLQHPRTLAALVVTNPDVDRIVSGALADPGIGGNPVSMMGENTTRLLQACL